MNPRAERELLPLPEADVDAFVPGRTELRVEPGREPVDHVVGAGAPDRALDRRPFLDVRVVADPTLAWREQLEAVEVLERAGEAIAPLVGRHAREVDAVDGDPPARRRVHVGQQLHERALAGAVLADERDHRAGRELDVHVGRAPRDRCPGTRTRRARSGCASVDAVGNRHLGVRALLAA